MMQTMRKLQLAIGSFSLNSRLPYTSSCQALCTGAVLPLGHYSGSWQFCLAGEAAGSASTHCAQGDGAGTPQIRGIRPNQTGSHWKHWSERSTAGSRQSMGSSRPGSSQQLALHLLRKYMPSGPTGAKLPLQSWLPRHLWYR